MRTRTAPVAALLFASGFCALVYQVAWLREFRLIFGASTLASAAVLAIFVGGLGIGGLLLGPRADRHPRPLLFYATLESIVAVFAALSPWLLTLARTIYLASGGSTRLGVAAATVERLLLSVIVLAVPTIAMGGTLPAAAINLLVAVIARGVDRRSTEPSHASASDRPDLLDPHDLPDPRDLPDARDLRDPRDLPVSPDLPALPVFLLIASATVGFAFFLMELVWYRLLSPLLGGSVFTFGLVLAVALVGIGIGGLLYALVAHERPPTLLGFAATCLFEALAVALTFALGDRVALLALTFLQLSATGFSAAVAGWTIVTAIVVLPPAIISGYQFPLLIALFGRGRDRLGRDVGLAYAANTAGAIIGSLAGGFGVMPWLSAPGAWRLVAVVLVALGAAAAGLSLMNAETEESADSSGLRAPRTLRSIVLPFALAAVTLLLLAAEGPTAIWRHSGIGAGRAPRDVMTSANHLRSWEQAERRAMIWEGDGVESSVALAAEETGYSFIVNGKSDGSAVADAGTQVMLGLIGALKIPEPRHALVVGLGTGSTAGWLAAIPSMERVDAIELEPLVLDVARASDIVNHNAMHNPKVRVTIADARETLLTTSERYDIIASEPSNPFRAGIASMFTVEYYRAANARLTRDGVFAQWVQGYEIDARTLRTIYATMAAVFPQIETWQTNQGDLVLLATTRPRGYNAAALRARIAEEPIKTALANVWRVVNIHGVLAHYLATDAVARVLATAPHVEVNTDDRNIVEFGMARSVGRSGSSLLAEIRELSHSMKASHLPFDSDAGIRWDVVETASTVFVRTGSPVVLNGVSPQEQQRQAAIRRFYVDKDTSGARELWRQQTEPPRDPTELAMAAEILADEGSDAALPVIERLRGYQPAEADVVLAALRYRQGRLEEAAAVLKLAIARLQVDPWPLLRLKQLALDIAAAVGKQRPTTARSLFDALKPPFSVRATDTTRLLTRLDLTTHFDFRGACREAISELEPHVPWNGAFLAMRRDCYEATGDQRLAIAIRDLNELLAHEPLALDPR